MLRNVSVKSPITWMKRLSAPRKALSATPASSRTSSTVLLLAGVALSAFLGALNRFIQVIGDFTDTFRSMRWMMGSMDVGSYTDIVMALVPMTLALVAIATLPR